jgi:chromosome segregation ATPase
MNNYQADIQGQMGDLRAQNSKQIVDNRDLERKLVGLQDNYKRLRAELHDTEHEAQRLNAENVQLENKKAKSEEELREIKD